MNPQIRSIADIYRFDTFMVGLVLEDLSDEHAGRRWRNGDGSSITFLVGHMLSSRVGLLKRFGETEDNPFAETFGALVDSKDASEYPPIADLKTRWHEVGERLAKTLDGLTDEDLNKPAEGFPIDDDTDRGALAFLAWHESYHVGQIGLMLTEMGLPSVRTTLFKSIQKDE